MKPLTIIPLILLIAASSFYGGMKYQSSKNTSPLAQGMSFGQNGGSRQLRMGGSGNFAGAMGMNRNSGGFLNGEILSNDVAKNILTIKTRDNGTKLAFYTSSTQVRVMEDGALKDVAIGKTVTLTGTQNSDGSVTAQSIQLRPDEPNNPQQ